MATLAVIRDQVRQLSLLSTSDIADAKVDLFINEGLSRLSYLFDWPWLETSSTVTITADTAEVTTSWPATWSKIRAVMLDGESGRLREISDIEAWERFGDDPPSGTPTSFYLFGGAMFVQPVPTANTDLQLHYLVQPTLLSADGDSPAFDSQFHLVLADWALARIWEREEDNVKARQYSSAFDRTVNDMARYYLNRASAQPIVFGESPDWVQRRRGANNMPFLDGA